MAPINSTGLSAIGAIKWMLVIAALPLFLKAWQGMVERKTATGSGRRVGDLLTGDAAFRFGLESLWAALVCLVLAWALWFFWQSHEE